MRRTFAMERPNDIISFSSHTAFQTWPVRFLPIKGSREQYYGPSEIAGTLLLRDGLPIVDPNGDGHVKGTLICFTSSKAAEEAYDRILSLEPDRHYRWGKAEASGRTANVLFGRSPRKGSIQCEKDEWDAWDDPLFSSALDVVEETLHSQKQPRVGFEAAFQVADGISTTLVSYRAIRFTPIPSRE